MLAVELGHFRPPNFAELNSIRDPSEHDPSRNLRAAARTHDIQTGYWVPAKSINAQLKSALLGCKLGTYFAKETAGLLGAVALCAKLNIRDAPVTSTVST